MWIVALAWLYVALMMALAEATHPAGTVLGAVFTFLMYGAAPIGLVLYIGSSGARRRARRQREAAFLSGNSSGHSPDAGGHAPGDAVAAEGKEP